MAKKKEYPDSTMPALLEKSADLQKKVDDVLDMWKQQEEEAPASTDSNLYARPEK